MAGNRTFGDYVIIDENITVEKAKEVLVERMCEELHRIAKEEPQLLFIEKEARGIYPHTVGCKLLIPEH